MLHTPISTSRYERDDKPVSETSPNGASSMRCVRSPAANPIGGHHDTTRWAGTLSNQAGKLDLTPTLERENGQRRGAFRSLGNPLYPDPKMATSVTPECSMAPKEVPERSASFGQTHPRRTS
jgi:hypothetical protein